MEVANAGRKKRINSLRRRSLRARQFQVARLQLTALSAIDMDKKYSSKNSGSEKLTGTQNRVPVLCPLDCKSNLVGGGTKDEDEGCYSGYMDGLCSSNDIEHEDSTAVGNRLLLIADHGSRKLEGFQEGNAVRRGENISKNEDEDSESRDHEDDKYGDVDGIYKEGYQQDCLIKRSEGLTSPVFGSGEYLKVAAVDPVNQVVQRKRELYQWLADKIALAKSWKLPRESRW